MTISIIVQLPIEPGATMCEGCPFQIAHVCTQFYGNGGKRLYWNGGHRLPQCFAAERIKTGESWEVQCSDGHRATGYTRKEHAVAFIQHYCTGALEGSKLVHVARYRKAKP